MAVRFEYYNTNEDSQVPVYGATWKAQTFTTTVGFKITSVKLLVYKAGTPGNLTVSIQGVDGSNKPDGSDISGLAITVSPTNYTTTTTGQWVEYTFPTPTALDATTRYAIVMRAVGGDNDNDVNFKADISSPTYTNGEVLTSVDSGSSWIAVSSADMLFEIYGTPLVPLDKVYTKRLVAIGNNEVWYEATIGRLDELLAANGNIDTTKPLTTAEGFQKLFIANQTNLKVIDFVNVKLTTGAIGTDPPDFGTVLTSNGAGSPSMIVDYITSLSSACIIYGKRTTAAVFADTETVTGTDDDGNAISFVLTANEDLPPHWYNWTVFGGSATFGTMPSSAYLVCRYRGRIVLAGNPNSPHQWYMSKVANPWNFIYASTDPLSAVAGTNADAGEAGDIIRALVPFGDDYLIFGCANSIFLLDGDPVSGGSLDEIDNSTGMYGPWAWCKDGEGNLYFWGSGGLYKMSGGRGRPENISTGRLPKWVNDWAADPATHRIVLAYDSFRNGITISRTTLDSGTNLNYWYDFRTQGFYPETYPTACGIFCSHFYDADSATRRCTLYGGNDGYIRKFLDTVKNDDVGTTDRQISSYATWPIEHLAEDNDKEGKLTSLTIELAGGGAGGDFGDTDEVDYEIHVADDAETCLQKIKDGDTAFTSGTLSGTGRKARIRTRVRGAYLGLKLYNVITTTAWATATDYAVDDLVVYSNIEYVCIVAHTSEAGGGTHEEPDTNTTDWTATTAQTWVINKIYGDVRETGKIK